MLTRDPLVLRALGSLSDCALGSLDGLIEQGTFFQSAEPLMWHGQALRSGWMPKLVTPPGSFPSSLLACRLTCVLLFMFELRAPSFFQALLQPGEQHLRAFGVSLQPGTLPRVALIEEDTVVWRIGSPLPLFAGAFHGWGQALECINRSLGLEVAHEVLVDNSPIVVSAQAAILDIEAVQLQRMSSWVPTPAHVAVLADVGDTSLLHVIPWTGCHVATASPPCPPWSQASSRDGLEDPAGVCFLETMLWARRAAPLALLMECVDALPVHPHYPIILAFIRWAGFTTLLHNHAVFGPCTRRRWLAVLLRHDVDLPPSQPVGLFQDPSPVPWTHESFQVQAATLPYYTNPSYLCWGRT